MFFFSTKLNMQWIKMINRTCVTLSRSPAGVLKLRYAVGRGHLHGAPTTEEDQVGGRPAPVWTRRQCSSGCLQVRSLLPYCVVTVKPQLAVTFIKQPTCFKQPYRCSQILVSYWYLCGRHIVFALSVCPFVLLSVCPSVTLCFRSITRVPFDPEPSNFIGW